MSDPQRPVTYVWRSKKQHPHRFGEECWIVTRPGAASDFVSVEFADGEQVITLRTALRRAL